MTSSLPTNATLRKLRGLLTHLADLQTVINTQQPTSSPNHLRNTLNYMHGKNACASMQHAARLIYTYEINFNCCAY